MNLQCLGHRFHWASSRSNHFTGVAERERWIDWSGKCGIGEETKGIEWERKRDEEIEGENGEGKWWQKIQRDAGYVWFWHSGKLPFECQKIAKILPFF